MADKADSGIYEIVNLVNGKRYIGSAIDLKSRWRGHRHDLKKGSHHSIALQRAWDKYGQDSFRFSVLSICQKTDLITKEQESFDIFLPEYNVLKIAGSTLGSTKSESAREKMRAYRIGKKLSAETRAKISESQKGKPKSAKAIANFSAARKGSKISPHSESQKANISAAHLGRKLTPEHAAAISLGKTGKPRPDMIGNKWGVFVKTVEHRAQMSLARKGRSKSPETVARMRAAWVKRKAQKAALE